MQSSLFPSISNLLQINLFNTIVPIGWLGYFCLVPLFFHLFQLLRNVFSVLHVAFLGRDAVGLLSKILSLIAIANALRQIMRPYSS